MARPLLRKGWPAGIVRRPGFWLLAALLAAITVVHHREALQHPGFLIRVMAAFGLERHAFERVLFLAPIVWAGFLYGSRGAFVASLIALVAMLPRAVLASSYPKDALFETASVFVVGNLVAVSFEALRRERERRLQLAALNRTFSVVSQSIELGTVLKSSITTVKEVMKVDGVLVFLVDEKAGELSFAAYEGVSPRFAEGMSSLRVGEGFNGRVAATGETLFVEDASLDPALTRAVVGEEGIRSQLIVPLKSKGRVVGTLCAAVRARRRFRQDEVELLTAIGNQVGVAIENARLYEQQREMTERVRASEERYRELFEGAHDAIWLHDLGGHIIVANAAFARLTGYALDELQNLRARDLMAPHCLETIERIEAPVQAGEEAGVLAEVTLVRKDRSEAAVQLSTSLVFSEGRLVAFQHIARDVTEEKRLKESMRYYLQQAARAQEEERKRIARELHDDTIQALVVLSRQLEEIASNRKGLSKETRLHLESLRQQANGVMDGVRRLSQDLRPPTLDRLGLLPALQGMAADVALRSGIAVEVVVQGGERRLDAEAELMLFRIAQEAIRNVWRHSQATRAEVAVEFRKGETRVAVSDNGRGFELSGPVSDLAREGKLGLAGMQERARLLGGELSVRSEPGRGTTVAVSVPR